MLEGSGIPIITEDIEAELVTPTGFGILKTVSESSSKMPEMLVECVGYGFGKTETGRLNALRVIMGTKKADNVFKGADESSQEKIIEKVTLLETNIDDTNGKTKEGRSIRFMVYSYSDEEKPSCIYDDCTMQGI